MRKTIASLLLAASLPVIAMSAMADPNAGQPDCPMGAPGAMMERGHEGGHGRERGEGFGPMGGMNLNAEQHAAVRDAMRDYARSERDRVQTYLERLPAAEKAAMQKDAEASRQQRDKAIEAALTPEQLKQFRAMQAQMDKRRAEREEFEAWKARRDAGKAQ